MSSKIFATKIFTIIFGSIGVTNLMLLLGVKVALGGFGVMDFLTSIVIALFMYIIYDTTKEIYNLIVSSESISKN